MDRINVYLKLGRSPNIESLSPRPRWDTDFPAAFSDRAFVSILVWIGVR